jgi:Ca2+/Na+ antiporter
LISTLITLVLSLAAILAAAIVFTNAVEMLGDRLRLGGGAVGSVLAAVGTALPETMIPIVAIVGALLTGGGAAEQIGVGAILGAPFLLTTLAMFVVGASALGFRGRRESGVELDVEQETTRRDLLYFLVFFALVLAPLATELPEKFNSVYWMRDNEDTLAFGNITGAMVFQSMVPVALGLVFTPWGFGFLNTLAAGLALLSGALLYVLLGRKGRVRGAYLLVGGVFYAAFLAVALVSIL